MNEAKPLVDDMVSRDHAPSTSGVSGSEAALIEEAQRLLQSFGCYPKDWDALSPETRLEVRVEKPAKLWSKHAVYWRMGDLHRAAAFCRAANVYAREHSSPRQVVDASPGEP